MSTVDEVKQKTDIVEVISQYTPLTKSGRTFRGLCPFHSEKRPSFFVYPEQQSWHCFGACNTGGDVLSFIMKRENTDFGEALRLLAERAGVTIQARPLRDDGKDDRERLYRINGAAAQYFHNLLLNSDAAAKAKSYLDSRGLSGKTIADFQLGFSPGSWEALKQYLEDRGYTESEMLEAGLIIASEDGKTHDRFRNRLMFPINDARGRVIGFGARALDDSFPKYLNSPQTPLFDKSGSLYAINLATSAIRQKDLAVIVEGYMDVITAHQNSFTNVIAAMGTSITERQISALKRLTRKMALALDADTAGQEAMLRCVDYENSLDAEVKIVILPEDKDPDDVIREDPERWQHLLNEALPAVDYTFAMVTAKLDLTAAMDKSLAVDRLLPIIAEIKDVVRQAHYLQKLARLVKVSERDLEPALRRIKAAANSRPLRESKKRGQEPAARAVPSFLSSPLEEHCLALLLQYPDLKDRNEGLTAEHFENSENREIFIAWQQVDDLASLRDKLDPAIWEHLDILLGKNMPSNEIEPRYADSTRRLRERFFKTLEARRAETFALEAEAGGAGADLARLKEEGIEPSIQLKEIFSQKARRSQGQRR